MRLVCYVSGGPGFDWGCYAALDLDRAAAEALLAVRPALAAAAAVSARVSCVQLWDYHMDYFKSVGEDFPFGTDDEWIVDDAGDCELSDPVRTDVNRAVLRDSGVTWEALAGDIALETYEVTWAQLEAIARGEV